MRIVKHNGKWDRKRFLNFCLKEENEFKFVITTIMFPSQLCPLTMEVDSSIAFEQVKDNKRNERYNRND